ncbi:hypothetical protein N7485_005263 [Penicillium canescens]|nr:hypothetical protein N7485_005263 [Penicillium canescens]
MSSRSPMHWLLTTTVYEPKIKPLAREFDVSYQTLLGTIHGARSAVGRPAPNKALDSVQEEALLDWITFMDSCGAPPTAASIQQRADDIIHRSDPDRKPLWHGWGLAFTKRLPKLALHLRFIKQKPKDPKRMGAEDATNHRVYRHKYAESDDEIAEARGHGGRRRHDQDAAIRREIKAIREEEDRVHCRGYRLLLFDGHKSHCTPEFILKCWENRIVPYAFRPHVSHICQPLDSVPFQRYKALYRRNNVEVVQ